MDRKPLFWVGSSYKDLMRLPDNIRNEAGFALDFAQKGELAPCAIPMSGFRGTKVVEIVMDHRGDTFRVVYTVKLAGNVYVLHAFQKKSKREAKTPSSTWS